MEFKLPELGEGVHEGELIRWKVVVGQQVDYDQPICEIMTDKASVEIPSPFCGKVEQICAQEGQVVHVGQVLLNWLGEGAVVAEAPREVPQGQKAPEIVAIPSVRAFASPATRKLAKEMGVDLTALVGTGPQGRVLKEDLKNLPCSHAKKAGPSEERRVPLRGLRKKIAEKMRQSKDKAAHFSYFEEADATELVKLRAQAKQWGETQGIKVTYLPFIMKAMVVALKKYPILNTTLDEERGEIVFKNEVNIGLSIQTDEGLTAPVVKHVAQKTIFELAQEIQHLVDRARKKQLVLEDFQDGTITLTNVGSIGGLFSTPVINFPEVAIVGFNKIFRKPVVQKIQGKEEIVIRDWTYFSISLDHRIVDGAIGAEFMKELIHLVENPSLLLLS